jgi:type II secretory pathway pseudopilin PulG
MKTFARPCTRGFTLLEFALTVLVAAAVSVFLMNRFAFYREQAELAATRQLVGAAHRAACARRPAAGGQPA